MKMELPEILHGVDFASSADNGLALTATWILSIFDFWREGGSQELMFENLKSTIFGVPGFFSRLRESRFSLFVSLLDWFSYLTKKKRLV